MDIVLNGDAAQVAEACTLGQLAQDLGLAGQRYAVEVNMEIIPRSQHSTFRLNPGDRVEIVHAIGGG